MNIMHDVTSVHGIDTPGILNSPIIAHIDMPHFQDFGSLWQSLALRLLVVVVSATHTADRLGHAHGRKYTGLASM